MIFGRDWIGEVDDFEIRRTLEIGIRYWICEERSRGKDKLAYFDVFFDLDSTHCEVLMRNIGTEKVE